MDFRADVNDDGTYMLNITLGRLLVLLFLSNVVVLASIQSLFKDVFLFCVARRLVARGFPVTLKRAPRILRALGIDKLHASRGHQLTVAALLRLLVTFQLIVAGALFENSLEQLHLPTVATFVTLAEPPHPLVIRAARATVVLSPFPTAPLAEDRVGRLAPFSPNGSAFSRVGPYRVREDPRVALSFSSSCVSAPDPNSSVVRVYAAALIAPGDRAAPVADAAAPSGRVRELRCLDGKAATARRVAATFRARDDLQMGAPVTRVELVPLANEAGLATDGISGLFGAVVEDDSGTQHKGYVTVTKRSHFDANVEFSMYGLVRAPDDDEVLRVNIPLYLSGRTRKPSFPCWVSGVTVAYAGNWTFDGGMYTCPDGVPRPLKRDAQEVQSVGLRINPAMPSEAAGAANGTDSASGDARNLDLLVWLAETDYARFTAGAKFSEELTMRVRSRRLFYSAVGGQAVSTTDGGQREAVQVGRREAILFLTSISVLCLYVLLSVAWSLVQQRMWKMRSEVISFEAVMNMFCAAHRAASSRGGKFGDATSLTIGLRQAKEQRDGTEVDVQVLGPMGADEAVSRKAYMPLVGE